MSPAVGSGWPWPRWRSARASGCEVAGVADHHELFTEAPSRVVVCTTRRNELVSRAAEAGVGFRVLGTAGGDRWWSRAWSTWRVAEVTERLAGPAARRCWTSWLRSVA